MALTLPSRTKILATLGPACREPRVLREMVRAGVHAFRLNMSHGSEEERADLIRRVKKIRRTSGRPIAILADLRGPRIRLGRLPEDFSLKRGQEVTFKVGKTLGRDGRVPIDYSRLLKDVECGHRILIRDGRVRLKVLRREKNSLLCRVMVGGTIGANQGINLPDSQVSAPALSAKDRRDIAFAAEHELDWIALSFVRQGADLRALKREVAKHDFQVPIMAKIEHPAALENLESIFRQCNAVMVARGDLAVELGHAMVPTLQKRIIDDAIRHSLPVVVATQMLESMIEESQPTRAEVSDVANAVLDGADCVMLSGETAVGSYPVEACRVMKEVARETELQLFHDHQRLRPSLQPHGGQQANSPEMATVKAAICAAENSRARLILAFTESGRSARLVGSFRSQAPIVALTTSERSFHRMSLYWGVRPERLPRVRRIREMHRFAVKVLKDQNLIGPEQFLVSLTGSFAVSGATNTVRLIRFNQLA